MKIETFKSFLIAMLLFNFAIEKDGWLKILNLIFCGAWMLLAIIGLIDDLSGKRK